jgi:ribosomal protein S18 acetylase RimI-like enzyme
MHDDEFDAYKAYFIEDYAQEIMDNYGHSNLVALQMAKDAIKASFPHGITSDNEVLFAIDITAIDTGEGVDKSAIQLNDERAQLAGYLWRIKNDTDNSCFISDFYILPEMRSKGLGKLAIAALERDLKEEGIQQIKLRVAYQNMRATQLYKAMGFTITGINMSKLLC